MWVIIDPDGKELEETESNIPKECWNILITGSAHKRVMDFEIDDYIASGYSIKKVK